MINRLLGPNKFLNFRKAIGILDKKDRKKLTYITAIQVFLGILDLLGVLAVGLLGTLSVTGVQSRDPSSRVYKVLEILGISSFSIQAQASIIGLTAVSLLVGRTIISIFITRRILYFMSRRGAEISANLVRRLLSQPLLIVQKRSVQESLFAVTTGVEIIALQVLALSVVLVADVALLAILIFGLTIFGIGDAFLIVTNLGNSPWTVLAEGISLNTPLNIGASTFLVSALVLLFWIPLKQMPGFD